MKPKTPKKSQDVILETISLTAAIERARAAKPDAMQVIIENCQLTYLDEDQEADGLVKLNLFDDAGGFFSLFIRNCVLAVRGIALYGPDYSPEREEQGYDPRNFPSVRIESVSQVNGIACTLCLHGAFDDVLISGIAVDRLALGTADAAEADEDSFRCDTLSLIECRCKLLTTMDVEADFPSDECLVAFACNTLLWGGGEIDVVDWTMGACEPGGYYTDMDGKRKPLIPPDLGLVLVTDSAWANIIRLLCPLTPIRYHGKSTSNFYLGCAG